MRRAAAAVKQLQADAGCRMNISQEPDPADLTRTLSIRGAPETVARGRQVSEGAARSSAQQCADAAKTDAAGLCC